MLSTTKLTIGLRFFQTALFVWLCVVLFTINALANDGTAKTAASLIALIGLEIVVTTYPNGWTQIGSDGFGSSPYTLSTLRNSKTYGLLQGAVHFEWDANGAIQIQIDQDISKGASTAHGTANGALGLLQSIVTGQNSDNDAHGLSANNLAIDPSRMPSICYTAGASWMEITQPDGSITKENINPANDIAWSLIA